MDTAIQALTFECQTLHKSLPRITHTSASELLGAEGHSSGRMRSTSSVRDEARPRRGAGALKPSSSLPSAEEGDASGRVRSSSLPPYPPQELRRARTASNAEEPAPISEAACHGRHSHHGQTHCPPSHHSHHSHHTLSTHNTHNTHNTHGTHSTHSTHSTHRPHQTHQAHHSHTHPNYGIPAPPQPPPQHAWTHLATPLPPLPPPGPAGATWPAGVAAARQLPGGLAPDAQCHHPDPDVMKRLEALECRFREDRRGHESPTSPRSPGTAPLEASLPESGRTQHLPETSELHEVESKALCQEESSAAMTEEYVVATQQTIGTLITKPKMADKYLKKPPFRFLHDLVMEVTRATSFAQGLYNTEESDAEQLKEKGAKLDFLNKAISATCFALGESIDVSASKIVAGLEPEKTNAWLVKLHQAATTCVGEKSDAAVQRVLSGELIGAAKEKKKKPKEEGAPPPPPDGGGAEEAPAAPSAPPADDEAKKEEERKRRAEKKKREEERKRKEAEAAAAAEQPPPPEPPAPPQDDAEEERKKEEKRRKEEERRRRKEEEKRRAQDCTLQSTYSYCRFARCHVCIEEEEQRRQEEAAAEAAREDERRAEEAQAAMAQAGMADEGLQDAPPAPPGALSEGPASGPDEIAQRAQEMLAQQRAADNGRPRTAGRKPPKVTSKVTTTEQSTAPANVPAPVVIAEGTGAEDEEDMFEAGGPPPGAPPPPPPPTDDGGQHGALVSDLLAEKRKEEERERLKKEEEETREEFDDGSKGIKMKLRRKKDTGSAIVEVDPVKLGEAIQSLCQAANPLGKSIDLVHQDIANMGKELDHWKQEYRESSEAYGQQLKMTEDLLQPLYQKIAELDDKIAEQQAKIRNSRSRISKNDLKIQQLLETNGVDVQAGRGLLPPAGLTVEPMLLGQHNGLSAVVTGGVWTTPDPPWKAQQQGAAASVTSWASALPASPASPRTPRPLAAGEAGQAVSGAAMVSMAEAHVGCKASAAAHVRQPSPSSPPLPWSPIGGSLTPTGIQQPGHQSPPSPSPSTPPQPAPQAFSLRLPAPPGSLGRACFA
eukprot:s1816_g6.t1